MAYLKNLPKLPKVSFSTKENLVSKNIQKGFYSIVIASLGVIIASPDLFFNDPNGQAAVLLIGFLAILQNFLSHTLTIEPQK